MTIVIEIKINPEIENGSMEKISQSRTFAQETLPEASQRVNREVAQAHLKDLMANRRTHH